MVAGAWGPAPRRGKVTIRWLVLCLFPLRSIFFLFLFVFVCFFLLSFLLVFFFFFVSFFVLFFC